MSAVIRKRRRAMVSPESCEQIVLKLGELHKHLKKLQSRMLDDYHITLMEYHILAIVLKKGNASQNDIAEALDVDKALVSRQIRAMEQKELLICAADPECRRKNVLLLSDKALALMPELDELHSRGLERVFSGIDEKQLEVFQKVLEGLVSKL